MSPATFTDRVYEHIFNLLHRRDLRPGDVLDRKQIAGDLNVSLIPVSDAVQRLAHEGFLTTRRRQGTFLSGCDALADCFKRMIRLSMFHEMALIIPVQQSTYDRHVPLLTALCEASNDEAAARIRHHIWVGKDALMGAAS